VSSDTKPKILIVDADVEDSTNAAMVLGEHYNTVILDSGKKCLEQVLDINPDLILLEAILPGMDGFETCTDLKNDSSTNHIPVILVSSLDDDIVEEELSNVAADDYIRKPLETDRLVDSVNTLLSFRLAQ